MITYAGAGPAGLVAALTLLQNGVPVHIIDKELNHRIGRRGLGSVYAVPILLTYAPTTQSHTFELSHFLHVPEIHHTVHLIPLIREHGPTTLEPTWTFEMASAPVFQDGSNPAGISIFYTSFCISLNNSFFTPDLMYIISGEVASYSLS
ncbi:hypothetical protein HYDPIDRAFT_108268, partial [Hydnomerulius pinastri MD-312]